MNLEEKLSAALPEAARQIIARLEAAGFQAYAVGGCVRNVLLGREVHDWDLCSAASPQQVMELFSDCKVLPTGVEHGTVTILWEAVPFEVTMFRTESDYDGRKPHTVRPARTLREDLKRRDFTVNAMAYSPTRGLMDCHGGQEDLSHGILRAVGQPEERFREDYLRILRALRFRACYSLKIEKNTKAAMDACAEGLKLLSGERVWQELSRLLLGEGAGQVLEEQGTVLRGLGEKWKDFCFSAADGQALNRLPPDVCGRLALLLAQLPRRDAVLEDMKCPSAVKRRVSLIWRQAERWMAAGSGAHSTAQLPQAILHLLTSGMPLDVSDLAISGGELLAAGVPAGTAVGETLRRLLEAVWVGSVENEREALLNFLSATQTHPPKKDHPAW